MFISHKMAFDWAVDLETDFLRSQFWSWSQLFRTCFGLSLEPSWSRSRSLKLVSKPEIFVSKIIQFCKRLTQHLHYRFDN